MDLRRVFIFALVLGVAVLSHGPVFLLEPPAHLTFSNTTGSQVSCSAHGSPNPQVDWLLQDGQMVTAVPGLRQSLGNGTLYFPPFRAEDYRKDVHSTIYRCRASNLAGIILSREVNVRAVVNQHYEVQVYHTHVSAGNTAVLGCVIPAFVKEHVSVTSWSRDESILLPGSNMGGRIVVTYGTGELHIRSARAEDGLARYSCLTLHALTQERKRSSPAMLTVTDPIRSMAPRLAPSVQTTVSADRESDIHLTCSAQGNPPPVFNWFREINGHLQPVHSSARFEPSQDILHIRRLKAEDTGRWTCKVSNNFGEQRLDIHLTVTAYLSVHVLPQLQVINSGESAIFNCTVSGSPVGRIQWFRNGEVLPTDGNGKVKLLSPLVLAVSEVTRHDRGMYQCMVRNDRESAQGSAELRLGDTVPELQYTFIEQAMRPGPQVSLRCSATGSPPPQFRWLLDGEPLSDVKSGHRYAISQYVDQAGDVISHLNITNVRVEDGGLYSCRALNSLGSTEHSARLNIYGPPFIRSIGPVKAVATADVTIHCPYSGYPIDSVRWERHGQEVLQDLRHRLDEGKTTSDYQPVLSLHSRASLMANGSMWLETVSPQDEGHYLCRATNGIGSGLGKVIYVGVNEPARFDLPARNVSTKRGNSAVLLCHVYGDTPIEVVWTLNGNQLDLNNYRYSISSIKTENGVKSQVTISRTDREDSGVYKCLAENAFGRSEHIINLAVQERPDPPSMLEVVEVSSRSVRLAWKRPFDGNSPVIGYLVQYQILGANQGDWEQSHALNLTLPANTQTGYESPSREEAVISSLQPATVYTIRMLAVNSIDQSAFTEAIVVKSQEEEPSEAPKDVRVEAVGPGELFLTWSVPPRESWNGELLGYIVTWNENEGLANNSKSMTVKGWATNKLQLAGLKKFTRYDITVRAFNSVSAGPSSASIIGTTKEGVPEAPPQNIACTEISSQIMKISWTPPPLNFHGGLILGYKVFYRPISSEIMDILTTGEVKRTSSSETYLHGLYKFTNYSIKVLAYTGAGDGIMSQPLFCTTEEDLPGPPASIKAAALTGESILVSWLSPSKPNGRISLYTVYCREAGRVGKHTSYNMRIEDMVLVHGLIYEVRNLKEHQLYEFWVSATTTIGEGEPTSIIAQSTNSRAPSRIASFTQVLHKPDKSKVLLPCLAVGNPTPRTRWIHRDRPITFSPFYEVTSDGHLKIHSVDPSLAGNYTCSAKNLFGEDEITYTLVVLMPPSAPTLEVQFTTATSIRLHWTHPEDGGALIQGFTLNTKHDTDDWASIELSPELSVYTLENLRCGSLYHIYLLAHNRVGNGSPSPIQTVSTKGGPPHLPKEKDFIITNSTTLQLNLYNWPDGGCPIVQFSIQYKGYNEKKWIIVAKSVSEERIVVHNLTPATWYQLKISAENDAGTAQGFFNFATTTPTGGQIPMPTNLLEENAPTEEGVFFMEAYVVIPAIITVCLLIFLTVFWIVVYKRRRTTDDEAPQGEENELEHHHHHHEEKTAERDNRRNCQQVYTSSPVKSNEKLSDDASGMYEISPYATFSVPGPNNSRSVTTSTLDYTMQFKTFGHIEDDDHNAVMYPKNASGKHTWHKNRYYSNEAQNQQKAARLRQSRLATRGDSESDDTSGSPCGECPSGSSYRVPVKPARGERQTIGYTGYETLLVADLFRPDSSTESNDVSPLAERRHTPRHVGGRRHHRPTSSSR